MTRACSRWRTGSCRGSTRCRSATCRTSSLRSMRRSTIRTSRKSTTRRAAASGSGCDDHRAVRDHDAARVRGGRVVAAISRDDHRVVRGGTRDADDRDDRALRVRRALVDPRAARVAGDRDADPAQRASRCVEAQPALLDPRVHRARDLRADRDVRGRDIGRLCLLLGHEGTDLRPGAAVRHGVSPQSRSRRDASRVSAARPAVLRVDDARRATTRLVRRHGVRDSVPDAGDVRDSRRRIQSALRGPVLTKMEGAVFVVLVIALLFRKKLAAIPLLVLAAWLVFAKMNGLFGTSDPRYAFSLSYVWPAMKQLAGQLSFGLWFLPWIACGAAAARGRRIARVYVAAAIAFLAFMVLTYARPEAHLEWSAQRVLMTPLVLFFFSAITRSA